MSRKKRILEALEQAVEDFAVRPKRTRQAQTLPSQNPLAVRMQRAARARPLALPAPPRPLALPAPDPAKQLPSFAAKPRGGQWWSAKVMREFDPDTIARRQAEASRFADFVPVPDGMLDAYAPPAPEQEWLAKALSRYYKNDFGTPEDPLRSLAEQGLHYDPTMTPDEWSKVAQSRIKAQPLGQMIFPPNRAGGMPGVGDDWRGNIMADMPWLSKLPVTENVYGLRGGLDLAHFEDELYNALNPDVSGLPPDLALRPESLARMSFPQAVERVGRINQFRVKQMENAAQALANNPAVQTFKEYPDAGYRWVELRAPDMIDNLEDANVEAYTRARDAGNLDEYRSELARRSLQDALKFEGDTMGHCVGGYCDDVLSGRSRIFSLRDAKGQPHVTIETAPHKPNPLFVSPEVYDRFRAEVLAEMGLPDGPRSIDDFNNMDFAIDDKIAAWRAEQAAAASFPDNIVQIKGKQNRAPVDEYLPYVQDFVKSGTWSNIGDFRNTGLVRLPDGRYITTQQLDEVINSPSAVQMMGSAENARTNLAQWNLNTFDDDDWRTVGPLFEGYAIGGRVDASRCFSRNPLSVRAAQ